MSLDRLRIQTVDFTDTHLRLGLAGGRTVEGFLRRHNLLDATPEQRAGWILSDDALSVRWPALGRSGGKGITVDAQGLAWDRICEDALAELARGGWKLDALPARRQEIVALWRLEADGYNGGFLQFFCNWGEANCAIALGALQAVGADATHAVVSRQRAVLARLENHPQLHSYDDIPRLLSEEERTLVGEELDQALWDAAEEIPLRGASHYFDELQLPA
ncbi:MAG: DUF4375 domain-containing protein [Proteobacteria bacterium]|nr:DUF4375 domain-containing protein [Pseudomonadota bacterium]